MPKLKSPFGLNRSASQRAKPGLTTADVSQQDALWFSRLPEKVKRGQFTVEEQILLTGRQNTVILDAADERLYKLGGTRVVTRSIPSLEGSESEQSSPDTLESANSFESAETFDFDDFGSVCSSEDMDDEWRESFRWIDNDEPNLTLDDYHAHLVETVEPKLKPSTKKPSYRRHDSFSDFLKGRSRQQSTASKPIKAAVEQWGSGWAPAPPSDDGPEPSSPASSQQARPRLGKANTSTFIDQLGPDRASAERKPEGRSMSIDNTATHYLNPEARLKLRLYLASPSKFDEAIEFGFPSLQSPVESRPTLSSYPSSSSNRRHSHSKSMYLANNPPKQTFLDDGTTNSPEPWSQDRLDLESSASRRSSVSTDINDASATASPVVSEFGRIYPSTPRPVTAERGTPQGWIDPTLEHKHSMRDPYPHAVQGREMTLRMTLTRPDLRADESVLYPDSAVRPTTVLGRNSSARERLTTAGTGIGTETDLLRLEDLNLGGEEMAMLGKEKEGVVRRLLGRKK